MIERRAPGECMTEAERLAMLARLREIAQDYADGRIDLARAQHEAQGVIAPVKRRVKRYVRRRAGGAP